MSSQAQTAPGNPMASPADAAPKQARKLRISISFRFAFFTVFLIAGVMGSVGYSLYVQQKTALTHEVLERGRSTAENLASSSREIMVSTKGDVLLLSILSTKAVQKGGPRAVEANYDISNWDHVLAGIKQAAQELKQDVPKVLSRSLSVVTGSAAPQNTDAASAQSSSLENEGILDAIIVDRDGMIVSHSKGTSEVGKPYKAPQFIQAASEQTPYPIYEHEDFIDGKRYVRRLFLIKEPISVTLPGETVPKDFGTVYLGVAEDLIQKVVFEVTMKLVVIALIAIALGLVFTLVLVAWLTRPIGKLVTGVAAIAGGDFDTRVKVTSHDELGELTEAFNTMAVSLGHNALLKGAFTRYVSDAALKQILSDPSKTGLHSKRTLATIYTSDVRGFTAMSETLEPEQVVQVINTYLSCQTEIILKHGGVVDKFIGDATIGVWGKETPGPDDAISAVRAAFEVQEYISKMNQEREAKGEVAKLIGIGINTGEVVSGNMGSSKKMEYTVTGEHVIYADQICAECTGGKVWISESTYERVKDSIIVEPVELKSKGHGDAAKVWQVNGFK